METTSEPRPAYLHFLVFFRVEGHLNFSFDDLAVAFAGAAGLCMAGGSCSNEVAIGTRRGDGLHLAFWSS